MSERRSAGEALSALCRDLEVAGLRDLFSCMDPLHPRYESWIRARENSPQGLQPLIDLFLLGRTARKCELASLDSRILEQLTAEGVLHDTPSGDLDLGGLCLLPTLGLWLLCQVPQPNPTLYYGDDSVGLASRLSARPGDTALDLCAGPGIQSLRLASMGARVTAVEINPVAAALAQLNAAANSLSDRMEVRIGDLYEMVKDEHFDVVCANPPLLPVPDDVPYPFVGHGGPDGLRITRRILAGLPRVLKPKGIGRLLGTTLSDGYLPLCIDELDAWGKENSMEVTMYVTSHHRLGAGDPYLEGLSQTSAATGEIQVEVARQRYLKCFHALGGTHMCAYFLHVARGRGGLSLADLAEDAPRDIWFVP